MYRQTKLLITAILVLVMILGVTQTAMAGPLPAKNAQLATLPNINYLGQGPGPFTVDGSNSMIVKTYGGSGFYFEIYPPGTTYEAKERERVWSIDNVPPGGMPAYHAQFVVFTQVTAGCVLDYVQIEDNIDDRINTFYVNDQPVHTVPQGMVTYGSFTVPVTGTLEFDAVDSVGLLYTPCQAQPTQPTPPTATATLPPSLTPTAPGITPSATATLPPDVTPTATATLPPDVTLTATSTQPPGITPGPSLTPPPDATTTSVPPTNPPEQPTPVGTAGSIPVTGGGPGPEQIGLMGFALMAALALIGSAWWRLLRQIRRNG